LDGDPEVEVLFCSYISISYICKISGQSPYHLIHGIYGRSSPVNFNKYNTDQPLEMYTRERRDKLVDGERSKGHVLGTQSLSDDENIRRDQPVDLSDSSLSASMRSSSESFLRPRICCRTNEEVRF
jgi:hypothetical protein